MNKDIDFCKYDRSIILRMCNCKLYLNKLTDIQRVALFSVRLFYDIVDMILECTNDEKLNLRNQSAIELT